MRWKIAKVEYEGFPLLLRVPEVLDFESQKKFPNLVVISHEFAEVQPSGLPEPDYNDRLTDLDSDLIDLFDDSNGLIVLIETFGGKRTYYYYIDTEVSVAKSFQTLQENHSEYDLVLSQKTDEAWRFIRRYSDDFGIWE